MDSRQIPFVETRADGTKMKMYGAYEKLSMGDIVVITTVPLDTVLEAVYRTRKNNIYLTLAVFFISVMVILLSN